MKKLVYAILICIIVAGAVIIGTMGLKADIIYSKNVRIDLYVGKDYDKQEIEQMAKEVFGINRALVQQVEYYGDMFSLTISQDTPNIEEKVEQFNTKINEKYELENKADEIQITYQPKIKLSSVLTPYILPLAISIGIILVYVMIRFRKIGIFKTLVFYVLTILAAETIYLSVFAITRLPINRIVIPIGLLIYVIVITIITAIQENKLSRYKLETEAKKKK